MCGWCLDFFFQAEDGIRDLVRSRGLGDVYKRQADGRTAGTAGASAEGINVAAIVGDGAALHGLLQRLSLIHI